MHQVKQKENVKHNVEIRNLTLHYSTSPQRISTVLFEMALCQDQKGLSGGSCLVGWEAGGQGGG